MFRVNSVGNPKLRAPLLIAGFPGIANIGRISVEFLIREFKAKPFLELYSSYFPEWVIREKALVKAFMIRCYHAKAAGKDIILATSDAQAVSPLGQYELSDEFLNVVEDYGVKTVVTMAAYVLPEREFRRGVFAAATDPKGFKKFWEKGAIALDGGMIVGMNGLVVGLAGMRGWRGICLMGATRGGVVDMDAAGEILRLLSEVYGFDLRVENLHKYGASIPDLRTTSGSEFPVREEDNIYI